MQPIKKKYANIDVIEISAQDPELNVVLMHGYGADASDLAPLAQYLNIGKRVRFIFPEGILQIPIGPGWFGRAWFPIDFEAIERIKRQGLDRDLSAAMPTGLDNAREEILKMLAELNLPLSKTVLAGFSQGSMMAVDITLRLPEKTAGLAILSGTLVDKASIENLAGRFSGYQFFQSHGKLDPILPFKMAAQLNEVLKESGWAGDLVEFDGGHEIPLKVLEGLKAYLQNIKSIG